MNKFDRDQLELLDKNNLISIVLTFQEQMQELQNTVDQQSTEIESLGKQIAGEYKHSKNPVVVKERKLSRANQSNIPIEEMVLQYRNLRKAIFEEATKPDSGSIHTQTENQEKLRQNFTNLCEEANLSLYQGTDKETATLIWHHLWSKIRFANMMSATAGKEIDDIKEIFDDYEAFSDSDWDIKSKGYNLIEGGRSVHDFLNRTGRFKGRQTIGNIVKLANTIAVARQLKIFMDNRSLDQPVLDFVTAGYSYDDVWSIHKRLLDIKYRGELTALHFMMDMGFPVIKPDTMISRIFLHWGWLHQVIDLPDDLSFEDLEGEGKYGSKYLYTKPKMYQPAIDLARRIVQNLDQETLRQDIGWVTGNSLREFDIFMVSYASVADSNMGIERRLFVK